MKLDASIRPAHPCRSGPRASVLAALLALLSACGSPAEQTSQAGSPTPQSPSASSEGASSGAAPSASTAPAPTSELLPQPTLVPPAAVEAAGASDRAVSVAPLPAGSCAGLEEDACGACVCERCAAELAECSSVAGCAEILACVRESGCSGRDCYCGSASLTDCLAGQAQGPCKDVVLRAPGGSAPTLQAPSAGPASDAALRVADCAQARSTCRDLCELSD